MVKVHFYCLGILLFFAVISILTGNDLITVAIETDYSFSQTLNETTSNLSFETEGNTLYFDSFISAVIWISIIGGIAIASSISVVGSGMSESGTKWMTSMIFYISIWTLLTVLSLPLIISITTYGLFIYVILSIIYASFTIIHISSV